MSYESCPQCHFDGSPCDVCGGPLTKSQRQVDVENEIAALARRSNVTSNDELKPCPFCGGTDIGVSTKFGHAECGQCGATGPWSQHDEAFLAAELKHYWCLRPIEDALRAEVAELTVERDRFREMFKAAKLSVCDLEAKLDKRDEPLTDEQAERAFAIAKENGVGECDTLAHGVQGIDAAIRRVRKGE